MAIEFSCVQCGKPLWASDGSAGQRVLCASCGHFSLVPEKKVEPQEDWTIPAQPVQSAAPREQAEPGQTPRVEPARLSGDAENPFTAPQQAQWTTYRAAGSDDNRAAIAMVLGVISIGAHLFCCGLGLPFAIAGLVVGIPAMKTQNRGLAIAGVVCSSLSLLVCLLALGGAFLFFLLAAA